MSKLRGSILDQPFQGDNSSSPGRNVPVPLIFATTGIPARGSSSAVPAITWVSPDGLAKQVRIQLQAVIGGDNITVNSLQFWPANVRVFYRVRYWVNDSSFASPFFSLPCSGMVPYTVNATKCEVFLYGLTTNAGPPNVGVNAPVIVACSAGEGPDPYVSVASFAQQLPNILSGASGLVAAEPTTLYRVKVHADIPGLSLAMNAATQPGIYEGNTPANQNLITLSGTPAMTLGGIMGRISTGGVLGTSTLSWAVMGTTREGGNYPNASANITIVGPVTAAAVALGNTGMTAVCTAGTYVQFEQYIFPAQRYWPMVIDTQSAPSTGANSVFTGPELNAMNGYSADWNMPEGVSTFFGTWFALSSTPDTFSAPQQNPVRVMWDALLVGNAGT